MLLIVRCTSSTHQLGTRADKSRQWITFCDPWPIWPISELTRNHDWYELRLLPIVCTPVAPTVDTYLHISECHQTYHSRKSRDSCLTSKVIETFIFFKSDWLHHRLIGDGSTGHRYWPMTHWTIISSGAVTVGQVSLCVHNSSGTNMAYIYIEESNRLDRQRKLTSLG